MYLLTSLIIIFKIGLIKFVVIYCWHYEDSGSDLTLKLDFL